MKAAGSSVGHHHDHSHGHDHHHHHHGATTGTRLWWSLALTIAFVGVETFYGLHSGSLALLSDAGHNFTDALALVLAAFGLLVGLRPANAQKTYGYQRAGVLAAFLNALTLIVLSGWILWESVERLRNPRPVPGEVMMAVAAVGLAVNVAVMLWLQRDKDHDLNIRAAWVHMLGDALGSVAIIAGAAVMRSTGWLRIDPVLSIIIGLLIVWSAWGILRESMNILLEALPHGMILADVESAVRQVEGVLDVHDLHIWSLGSRDHALSCHVLIADQPHSESEAILQRINGVLHQRFGIHHTTIQLEHAECVGAGACSIAERACPEPKCAMHRH